MYVAAIDIGTNSVRLLTAQWLDGQLVNKQKQLEMTRIGKDVDATGMLQESRMVDTIEALSKFRSYLNTLGIQTCPVFATSAVRDAKNREDFVTRVKSATGFEVSVIAGTTEAEMGFLGVVKGSRFHADPSKALVIDIGGGSTELIIGTSDGHLLKAFSLNIGAVRLTDRHNLKHSSQWDDFSGLIEDVKKALSEILTELREIPVSACYGIGGTATTLGAIHLAMATYDSEKIQGTYLSKADVHRIARALVASSYEEKLLLKGLMPKRADIIAAGAVILDTILGCLKLEGYHVSDNDNLEGAIFQENYAKGL